MPDYTDADFPRFVFYVPGPHQNVGFTYDQQLVTSQADYDDAIEAGYSDDIPTAQAAAAALASPDPQPAIDSVVPRRRGRPPKAAQGDSNG